MTIQTKSINAINDLQIAALVRHVAVRLAEQAPPSDGRKSVVMTRWETQRRFGIACWSMGDVKRLGGAARRYCTVYPHFIEEDGCASELEFVALLDDEEIS